MSRPGKPDGGLPGLPLSEIKAGSPQAVQTCPRADREVQAERHSEHVFDVAQKLADGGRDPISPTPMKRKADLLIP
jgi:hypothetical protein